MQAKGELVGLRRAMVRQIWLKARFIAIFIAWLFHFLGLHKQISNRIIEPWMHIEVVMSTTSLSNWFTLRDHEDAQPEIAELARQMRVLYENSTPKKLNAGDWHLPFVLWNEYICAGDLRKVSAARCARVSYLTHDGKRDMQRDIKLHDFLVVQEPRHASPTEHQAVALDKPERHGNFIGWKQYRKTIDRECIPEERYDYESGQKV
jgi:hypothetical protein